MISSIKNTLLVRLRFIQSFIQFKKFLNFTDFSPQKIDQNLKNTYIIIVVPWKLTAAPWFSIATALLLQKRGHKIQFLIDDLQFENSSDHKLQLSLITKTLSSFGKLGIIVEKLSNHTNFKVICDNELLDIKKLAFANAIHKNRGEEISSFFNSLYKKNEQLLTTNFPFVKTFVDENTTQTYIFPGGIYANSGLFEFLLKASNKPYFTFDSGFEVLLSTYKGIAAQFTDIPASLELLLSGDDTDKNIAITAANLEFEKRKNGTNKLNSQYQSFEQSENFDEVGILIPLNSPWDSAALNIASLFSGYNEWLLGTIGLILDNSNFNITIRQHPDERFWWGRTKTDFNQLINERYSDKRIQFVSCYEKVNSYALLMKSKAVICYSSTFGIEAAMVGKKVCVCSNVYYSKLGFSYNPSKIGDIKFFLKNIESNKLPVEYDRAHLTYYLGQQCNWLFTPFTPMMSDLNKWINMGIDNLESDPNVNIYLNSLENHLPMSYVNHKKKYYAI